MTFASAIAGPSRLPIQAVSRPLRHLCRRHASTSPDAVEGKDSSAAEAAAPVLDKGSKLARTKEAEMWASAAGFKLWVNGEGKMYKYPTQGQKAKWLGGNVPYATNPSFRPAPPLSNDLQNLIYADLKKPNLTIGQIAERYNVSKARIEGIKKLKEVEAEFNRQRAFLKGMEPLLGVTPLLDPKNQNVRESLFREDHITRTSQTSTAVEKEEEGRLEAGIGAGGAFGDHTVEKKQGIERVVFEYRDEETMLAERKAEAAARVAVQKEGEAAQKKAEQEAAPETPQSEQQQPLETSKKRIILPSVAYPTPRGAAYRFIDSSFSETSNKQGKKGRGPYRKK